MAGPNKSRLDLKDEEHMIAAGEDDDGWGGVPPVPENKVSIFVFLLHALPVGGTTEQVLVVHTYWSSF